MLRVVRIQSLHKPNFPCKLNINTLGTEVKGLVKRKQTNVEKTLMFLPTTTTETAISSGSAMCDDDDDDVRSHGRQTDRQA